MAGLLERFLDGPVFGGDNPEGPGAQLVEQASDSDSPAARGHDARFGAGRGRADGTPAVPRGRLLRSWPCATQLSRQVD